MKLADTPLIALHLSKRPHFDHFYDLLLSSLKVLQKYDRLADRVGADEKTFLDEFKIVRIRMEQMSIGNTQILSMYLNKLIIFNNKLAYHAPCCTKIIIGLHRNDLCRVGR